MKGTFDAFPQNKANHHIILSLLILLLSNSIFKKKNEKKGEFEKQKTSLIRKRQNKIQQSITLFPFLHVIIMKYFFQTSAPKSVLYFDFSFEFSLPKNLSILLLV